MVIDLFLFVLTAPAAEETEEIVEKMGSVDVAAANEVAPDREELPYEQVVVPQEGGPAAMDQVSTSQVNEIQQSAFYTDSSSYGEQRQKPVDEIITPMQGTFNFLQESTIDIETCKLFTENTDLVTVVNLVLCTR